MAESTELADLPNRLNEDLRLNLSRLSPRSLLSSYKSEKKAAKDLAAIWNFNAQAWFAPEGANPNKFRQWITPADRKALAGEALPLPSRITENLRLNVIGRKDRREAEGLGAKKINDILWVPAGTNPNDFAKWITPADKLALAGADLPLPVRLTKKLKLTASREEGKRSSSFGASWDKEEGAWIAPVGTNPNDFLDWLTTEEKALRAVRLTSFNGKVHDLRPASRVIESDRLNSGQLDDNAVRLVTQLAGLKEQTSHLSAGDSAAIAGVLREEMEAFLKGHDEVSTTKQDHYLDAQPSTYTKSDPNEIARAFSNLHDVFSNHLEDTGSPQKWLDEVSATKQDRYMDGPPPAYAGIVPQTDPITVFRALDDVSRANGALSNLLEDFNAAKERATKQEHDLDLPPPAYEKYEKIDPEAFARAFNHLSDMFSDKARSSQDATLAGLDDKALVAKQLEGLGKRVTDYSEENLLAIYDALNKDINAPHDRAKPGTNDRHAGLDDETLVAKQREGLGRGLSEAPSAYLAEDLVAIAKALRQDINPLHEREKSGKNDRFASQTAQSAKYAASDAEYAAAVDHELNRPPPPPYSARATEYAASDAEYAAAVAHELNPPSLPHSARAAEYAASDAEYAAAVDHELNRPPPPPYSARATEYAASDAEYAAAVAHELNPPHDHAEPGTDTHHSTLDGEAPGVPLTAGDEFLNAALATAQRVAAEERAAQALGGTEPETDVHHSTLDNEAPGALPTPEQFLAAATAAASEGVDSWQRRGFEQRAVSLTRE